MRQAPTSFMERHVAISLVLVVTLLVLTGVMLGRGVGLLGVQVVDLLVAHMDPAA